MAWSPKQSVLCRLKELDQILNQNGNVGLLMYKLDAAGPTYEPYLETCKGIKEVMVYKSTQYVRAYPYIKDFYYCEKLKTKWSSTKKSLHGECYLFFNKTDAEEAFKVMQDQSVEHLNKRVEYFQQLVENAKNMSV